MYGLHETHDSYEEERWNLLGDKFSERS